MEGLFWRSGDSLATWIRYRVYLTIHYSWSCLLVRCLYTQEYSFGGGFSTTTFLAKRESYLSEDSQFFLELAIILLHFVDFYLFELLLFFTFVEVYFLINFVCLMVIFFHMRIDFTILIYVFMLV